MGSKRKSVDRREGPALFPWAGLLGWWQSDQNVTLSGNRVAAWGSLVHSSHQLVPGSVAEGPIHETYGVEPRKSIRLLGTEASRLTLRNAPASGVMTMVVLNRVGHNAVALGEMAGFATQQRYYWGATNELYPIPNSLGLNQPNSVPRGTVCVTFVNHILFLTYKIPTGEAINAFDPELSSIGTFNNLFFDGQHQLYEAAIYSGFLDWDHRAELVAWFRNKYAQLADTVPAAPSSLAEVSHGTDHVAVSWTANSNNESGIEVWRDTDESGIFTLVGTAPALATSHSDTTVEAFGFYRYKVRSINSAGASSFSNIIGPIETT
jgi:hypothetical protein